MGDDEGFDAEVAVAVDEDEFGARNDRGGVVRLDDIDQLVLGAVVIIGLAVAMGSAVLLCRSSVAARSNKVDDLRQAASTATVDPELVALTAYGTDSDPVAEALGPHGVVSLQQQTDNRWCVETEVSALLSSQMVFFVIDEDGQFIETLDCRG